MSSRRGYLSAAGTAVAALAGLGGCAGPAPDLGSDGPPTDGPTSSATTDPEPTTDRPLSFNQAADGIALSDAEHRHSLFYVHIDVSHVHALDDQAVFVTLDATGAAAPPRLDDLALLAAGERYDATTDVSPSYGPPFLEGEPGYDRGRAAGRVAFPVPCPLDAPEARIVAGEAAWSLPDDLVAALAKPAPVFELVDFAYPDSVPADEPIPLAATVRHDGGPGPLRLVFTERVQLYNQERVTTTVPAGEVATVRVDFDDHLDAPTEVETVGVSVFGPGFSASEDVPLERS